MSGRIARRLRDVQQVADDGVFPVVVWLVLDAGRKERLRSAIQEAYPKGGKLFIVITADEFERLIRQGFDAKDLC